jgi:hypothetical protein
VQAKPAPAFLNRSPRIPPPPVYRPAANQHLPVRAVQRSKRPSGFISNSKKAAVLSHNLSSETDFMFDEKKPGISDANAAMPHRMSWSDINQSTDNFATGVEDDQDFERWTDRFLNAGEEKMEAVQDEIDEIEDDVKHKKKKKKLTQADQDEIEELEDRQDDLERLKEMQEKSQEDFRAARDKYETSQNATNRRTFEKQANSFHANVPDFGPHFGVNNPVSDHAHLHLPKKKKKKKSDRSRSPSPMSRHVLTMSPGRISTIAATQDKKKKTQILTTTGETVAPSQLRKKYQDQIDEHGTHFIKSFDPNFQFG